MKGSVCAPRSSHLYLLLVSCPQYSTIVYSSRVLPLLQVQENRYRADLAKPALARLYAIEKSLKVAKAGGKKVRTKGAKKALATRQ